MPNYDLLPEHLRDGMQRYIEKGVRPGDFMLSCLANNFVGAMCRADRTSAAHVKDIALFIHNEIPSNSWGSYERVRLWMESHAAPAAEEQED